MSQANGFNRPSIRRRGSLIRMVLLTVILSGPASLWATVAQFRPQPADLALHCGTTAIIVDGGTSDTIQAAIDALPATGGRVCLTNNIYPVYRPIRLRSGVRLMGQSQSGVILQRTAGFTAMEQTGLLLAGDGAEDIIIDHLTLDGNLAAADRAGATVFVHGIYMNAADDRRNNRVHIHSCTIRQCAHGLHLKGTNHIILYQLNLTDNGGVDLLWHNLYLRRCDYIQVVRCTSSWSSSGNGFQATLCHHLEVAGCTFNHNGYRGLRIGGASTMILIRDNEASYNNEGDFGSGAYGIGCSTEEGAPSRFSIIDNQTQWNDGGADGIKTTAACRTGQIEANVCRWNSTGYDIAGSGIVCDYAIDSQADDWNTKWVAIDPRLEQPIGIAGDFWAGFGVNLFDYALFADYWLTSPNATGWDNRFDLDSDNAIDLADLTLFTTSWLTACPPLP